MIYALGQRLFKNEDDAQDFVQDVYLEAFRKRDRFEGRSKYSTYLYSFALHRGLNRIRKDKRIQFEALDESQIPSEEIPPPTDSDPGVVREELNALPDVYRLPIVLFYFEKMACAEIARSLAMNENTIKSYLHRGRKILKQKLEERKRNERS